MTTEIAVTTAITATATTAKDGATVTATTNTTIVMIVGIAATTKTVTTAHAIDLPIEAPTMIMTNLFIILISCCRLPLIRQSA